MQLFEFISLNLLFEFIYHVNLLPRLEILAMNNILLIPFLSGFSVTSFILVLLVQSCPILCNSVDNSLPGSSVHEILQARILGWVAISFSRESLQPRDRTRVSCTTGRFFIDWATREALEINFKEKKIVSKNQTCTMEMNLF